MIHFFRRLDIYHPIQLVLIVSLICLISSVVLASETVAPQPYHRTQLLTGFTEARQTMELSSEVGGKCLAVHGEVGAVVPDSGVLAEIDRTFIDLDIQANRLEVESIKRQLQTEKKMLARYTTLIDKNSATEVKLDEVTLNVDLHEMKLQSLHNQYLRLRENRKRHTIMATKGWTLIQRKIEPGEYIRPGQVIAQLGDFSELTIPLALSFNELRILQQSGEISVYFPDTNLQTRGKIYRVSPGFSESTKKIPVDLLIEGDNNLNIRGGLRAEIRLKQVKNGAFTVPISAVISRYDAHWVVKENKERVRVLFLGVTDGGVSAIISSKALSPDEKILTTIPNDY